MKAKIFIPFFLLSFSLFGEMDLNSMSGLSLANSQKEIIINNRILLKVNGESISVMDVVKKMDLLFYRQFPEYASSPELRHQFYQVNWKSMLDSVIDDRLILADAKEKKVEVSDGDIRETMEDLFGPDVVLSLDKLALSYDEARKLVETELIVRRMVGMMVRSKAMTEVTPKEVRKLFEQVASQAPLDEKWVYRMLTIQTKDEVSGKSLADKALEMIAAQKVAFEEIPALLKQEGEGVDVRLSEVYKRSDRELSSQHRTVLESLGVGACSEPVVQTSKKDGSHVVRIFHLKEKEKASEVSLLDLEGKLNDELLGKAMERNSTAYSEKLRKHYGVTDTYIKSMIPEGNTPFALR